MQPLLTIPPVTSEPIQAVPNSVLHALSRHDPMRDTGQASDENNALLSMYLPDMCGELIMNRAELELLRREVETLRRAQRAFTQKCAARFQLTRQATQDSVQLAGAR